MTQAKDPSTPEIISLVLCTACPWPPGGGREMRSWAAIQALGGLGPVHVAVATHGAAEEGEPWKRLHEKDPVWVRSLHPPLDPALRSVMESVRPDVFVIDDWELGPLVVAANDYGIPAIYHCHNVETLLQLDARPGLSTEAALGLCKKEAILVRRAQQVWVCSGLDAESLARLYGCEAKMWVVPNAIDVERYSMRAPQPAAAHTESPPGPLRSLLFPATFSWAPNEQAALELIDDLLPCMRALAPELELRLWLVGREVSTKLRRHAETVPGVVVTGWVEDTRPFFSQADLMVVPLRVASGTRLKILEAFASGLPVVSTSTGAEGLDVSHGREIVLADDPQEFARSVVDLLRAPARAREMALHARHLVERAYTLEVVAQRVRQAVAAVTGSRPDGPDEAERQGAQPGRLRP